MMKNDDDDDDVDVVVVVVVGVYVTGRLVESDPFRIVVIIAILVNTALVGIQTSSSIVIKFPFFFGFVLVFAGCVGYLRGCCRRHIIVQSYKP